MRKERKMPSVIIGLIIIYSLGIVSIIAVYVMDPLAEWYSTVVIVMCGIMSVFVTLDCTTINEYNLSSSGLTIFLNLVFAVGSRVMERLDRELWWYSIYEMVVSMLVSIMLIQATSR
jgi:hypothetical protein